MNWYGATMRHWVRFLPEAYAEISDPAYFFDVVGEEIAQEVDAMADELAGDDPPGEGYFAKVGRLTAARWQAEEIVMHEYGMLPPGHDAGEDDDDAPAAGEGPMVPDHDDPSWAEVDAAQQEHAAGDAVG
jgi:hypothetical protein